MANALGLSGLALAAAGLIGLIAAVIIDRFEDYVGHSLAVLLGGLSLLLPAAIIDEGQRRTAFMSACLEDRKDYECVAMWRSGRQVTTVMPMPILMPR